MSKHCSFILVLIGILAASASLPSDVAAQYVRAEIEINAEQRSATVKGSFAGERRNLTFLKQAIGSSDLGSRISQMKAADKAGQTIDLRRLSSTEFASTTSISSFSYKLDLAATADPRSAAHASWLGADQGLLMLDDMLPTPLGSERGSADITFDLPSGWRLSGENEGKSFVAKDVLRAVFVVGREVRERPGQPMVSVAGAWHFTDSEFGSMADRIFGEYRRIFGGSPSEALRVVLLPFPQSNVPPGTWEAETRGSTVVLLSSDTAFKSQSLQRLHEQLRHEIFHLWVPNGVNLTGRYDWFYEGFGLYQSLKIAVSMNQIRFEDLLDTLSRAHNIDKTMTERRSLLQASEARWRGAETRVYARGMVAAFLCDLAIMAGSNRKESIDTLHRRIFATHRSGSTVADGNGVVMAALERYPATAPIVRDYIRGDKAIEWSVQLEAAGLENQPGTSHTSLRIKEKLNGSQKALLDELGYNNWRKLTRK